MKLSAANLPLPSDQSGIWWVALSGGLDSCVLLHALASLNLPVKLHALHVNHQISSNADTWQRHCEKCCAELKIPFTFVKVDVKNTGRGLEDAARVARHDVFEQHVGTNDYLLTAHHADDQTETLLLRLMRGAGVRGLAAMAQTRALTHGQLQRPLLNFTRAELFSYATENNLHWVEDESNANNHYDRNYLRNQVMPLLRNRWPQFAQKWQQTVELCAATECLIEEFSTQDFAQAKVQKEFIGSSISLDVTKNFSIVRRHNLLRFWLRGQGLNIPEQQHLAQFEKQMINARDNAEAQVNWGDVSMRIYRDRLFALPLADLPQVSVPFLNISVSLTPQLDLALPAGFCVKAEFNNRSTTPLVKSDLPNLSLRFRQGGERCKPSGRAHSQTLKRLLQEYHVAPWLRDSWPLLYSADQLVAVVGLWVCEGFQTNSDGYQLTYLKI